MSSRARRPDLTGRSLARTTRGLIAVACLLPAPLLHAQVAAPRYPWDGATTFSIGQPDAWQTTLGLATGVVRREGHAATTLEARVGAYYEILSPLLGLGGMQIELFGGTRDMEAHGGLRGRVVSPFARLGVGVEYDVVDRRVRPLLSINYPGRRGGLFHDGSMLRFDYRPGAERMLSIGIEAAFGRRIPLGTTRPYRDRVVLHPRPLTAVPLPADRPAVGDAMAEAGRQMAAIGELVVPWVDHTGSGGRASDRAVVARLEAIRALAGSTSIEDATRAAQAALVRAYAAALRGAGSPDSLVAHRAHLVADQARAILLEAVILPYDRLLGQSKDPDTLQEFAMLARGDFVRWLHVDARLTGEEVDRVLGVFAATLDLLEAERARAHRRQGTSRFVWLPFQLVLLPEEHDTQTELDALIARLTRETFSEGNDVSYVINEQFQYHLSRTIRAARRYHVLWTHDFRGRDEGGDPDEMAYRHVLGSYLAAMTARIRAYDSTGVFPTYLLIHDEVFYRANHGRLWLDLLEDPLRHEIRLPREYAAWEDSLRLAQQSLRTAVSQSRLLQAQRVQFGDGWLSNLVKVHVNITNTRDPTFWSWRVATAFPVPDTWMRDHRKLVFYDITEDDPYTGEALITGAGVGEHYANLSWEDRSLLLRGPATLAFKTAARDLLLSQGVRPDRIPAVLQARPLARDWESRIRATADVVSLGMDTANTVGAAGRPLRAVMLNNRTGFDTKQVNLAKAALYTLMPPGSVIKIPDSLWNGTFWGSVLIGAAMRGVRVLVIAPTLENAPARSFGSMIRSRELLWRLVMAQRLLAPVFDRHGGMVRVGLYASEIPVNDVPGKLLAVRRTLTEVEWLRTLFDFPPSVYRGLEELAAAFGQLPAPRREGREFEARARPLLHLKANFLASREAWTVMARDEWVTMTREFVPRRLQQLAARSAAVASFEDIPDARLDIGGDVVARWYDAMPIAQQAHVIFYTLLGSGNQNDRSMVSDGEAMIVLAGAPSVSATIDLLSIIGQSRWIDDPAELDRWLPRHTWLERRIAHWLKFAF